MMLTIGLLLGSAALIYFSCEFFVNGVEWAGQRFGVASSAVGTVLAAFGTALPESVVTFVAVVFGENDAQKEIGVGAALGGPLVLATLAYAVVGVVFATNKPRQRGDLLSDVDTDKLGRDQLWFICIFIFKVLLGLGAFSLKPWLGVLFFAAYAMYVWEEMRDKGEILEKGELEPLKLRPRDQSPSTVWILLQTVSALSVIFVSSRIFVHQLDAIGPWLGMRPQIVALLLSPVATELPEIMNAVIWVRQGKTVLALGNISGAMMIQATIPSAFGILFTPWLLEPPLLWAAFVTLAAVIGLYVLLRRHMLDSATLALFALLYVVFGCGLFFVR